jgi:hypothetical protein
MHTTARFIAAVALVWWAGDEIVRSVNPWRRVLALWRWPAWWPR